MILVLVPLLAGAGEAGRAPAADRSPAAAGDRSPAALERKYPFLREQPVPDRPLDARLVLSKEYRTLPGDTLRKIAHRLYGHKTWWKKVKEDNKHFLSYRPDDILPPGKVIRYRAPKLGKEYVVQEGDWLIRIAQWKYGNMELWQKLYEKNKDRIRDPDLIHPGDRLRFHRDGTISVAGSNKVVVRGVGGKTAEKAGKIEENPAEEPPADPAPVFGATPDQYGAPREEPAAAEAPATGTPAAGTAEERAGLDTAPLTADPWRKEPESTEVAANRGDRGPSSEEDPWWGAWPARLAFLVLLLALAWAFAAYARSRDLVLYPKRGFRGYAFDRKPPKPTRGPYDDLSLDEDFLDEANVDRIDIRPRPNYQGLWKQWLRKRLRRLRNDVKS